MSSIPYYLYAAIMMDSAMETTHLAELFNNMHHAYMFPSGIISNRLYPIRSNRDGFFWMQLSERPTHYQISNMFQVFIKEAHPWQMVFVVTNLSDKEHAHINLYRKSIADEMFRYQFVLLERPFGLPSHLVDIPQGIATQMDDFYLHSAVLEERFYPIFYDPICKLYDRQEIII